MGEPACAEAGYQMGTRMLQYQLVLLVGICALSMTAAEEALSLDSASATQNGLVLPGVASERESLVQVTPQVPDGPVVQKFKKMKAKKKLDKEIVQAKESMKPMLKRQKVKKKAQKNKMGMLADLEIKRRKSKNELKLKKKAQDDRKKRQARWRSAKKRRMERYQKFNFEKLESQKERIAKLGKNMVGAKSLVERLKKSQQKKSKELAAKFTAKIKADNKEQLKVGGVIHLKGTQIREKYLVDLNTKLSLANKNPTNQNIRMAKLVFSHAAMSVAKEKEKFDAAARKRKELKDKRKEKKVKIRNDRKDKKYKKVGELINKEKRAKHRRQELLRKHMERGKKKTAQLWQQARNKVNAARRAILNREKGAKGVYNNKMGKIAREKARKAPMEAFNKAKTVVKERGNKVTKAKKKPQKFIAKTMKERAVKRMTEKGVKAKAKVPSRRRRINIRRRRYTSIYVRNSQIRLRAGYCLDASQRNRSGGKVHMWPCNTRNWNQQWNYNSVTGLIQNSHGVCLDASQRNRQNGKVHMWGCSSRNWNQKWVYNTHNGQIKNRYGICLSVQGAAQRKRAGGVVSMSSCRAGYADQKWTISGYRL